MAYRKKIEVTDTGMVVAQVYADDGRRVGLDFFTPFPLYRTVKAIEAQAKKAHKWADDYMVMCERSEHA